jgi:hypothetical protein
LTREKLKRRPEIGSAFEPPRSLHPACACPAAAWRVSPALKSDVAARSTCEAQHDIACGSGIWSELYFEDLIPVGLQTCCLGEFDDLASGRNFLELSLAESLDPAASTQIP